MNTFRSKATFTSEALLRGLTLLRNQGARWFGKGINSIIDEGSISGSNFIISIMLARWLPAADYGAYVLTFSIFLLLSSVQQTLILEPMIVFGPACYSDRVSSYVRGLLKYQVRFSLPVVVLLGISAGFCALTNKGSGLTGAFLGLAFAGPCILAFWLARAACYIQVRPGPAAISGILYSSIMLGGLLVTYRAKLLSPVMAFVLMGIGSLISTVLLFAKLELTKADPEDTHNRFPNLWRQHWGYGHWELGTLLAGWLSENVWYLLAASFLGMAQVGALRALTNIFLPAQRTLLALRRLSLPHLSAKAGKYGPTAVRNVVTAVAVLSGISVLSYCLIAILLRNTIFEFLYAGKFHEYGYLLFWVALPMVFSSVAQGYGLAVRAAQSPSLFFYAAAAEAVAFVIISVPATLLFGLGGIVGAACVSKFVLLLVSAVLASRVTISSSQPVNARPGPDVIVQIEAPENVI